MANNIAVTAGSGTNIATDDVSGTHYQVVKLAAGVEDDATRLGHLEDAAHTSGDAGIVALTKRTDAAASSAGTDADYATLNTDASGKLWVSGAFAEDAAHTDGDKGLFVLSRRKDTAATSAGTDGDYATIDTDGSGRVWVHAGAIDAGETHLGEIGGNLITTSASFTRPSDTTAYAVNDAVNNSTSAPTILTFANAARVAQGSGYVVGARIQKSTTGVTAPSFRLHLYHTTVALQNDNSAMSVLYANATKRIGVIDFTMNTDGTDGAEAQDFSLRIGFKCDAADTNIYGMLQAKGAYAPGNAEQFTIELTIDRN